MKRILPAALLPLGSGQTDSASPASGAAIMTALALGSSAVSRSQGGCYAVCQQGETCNEKTGWCEPLPCRGQCRADESCEEGFFGIKCVPGGAITGVTSPAAAPAPAKSVPAPEASPDKDKRPGPAAAKP